MQVRGTPHRKSCSFTLANGHALCAGYTGVAPAPTTGATTTVPPVGYDASGAPVCPPGTMPTTGTGYTAGRAL